VSKIKKRFKQPDRWSLKDHWLVGYEWEIISSKGDNKYYVGATDAGFICSCYGFAFHGKCRHIRSVIDRLTADEVPEYKIV
jgi:hypothetical protein